jgi:hypothetical protein
MFSVEYIINDATYVPLAYIHIATKIMFLLSTYVRNTSWFFFFALHADSFTVLVMHSCGHRFSNIKYHVNLGG